jgi:hypothetical protein
LRLRYRWIILIVVVWLAGAIMLDQDKLLTGVAGQANRINGIPFVEAVTIETCELSQVSYSGPLIPDHGEPSTGSNLSDHQPDYKEAESARSSRSGFSISTSTDPLYWAELLGSGWYLDWRIQNASPNDTLEHWQMVRVQEDCVFPSVEEIQSVAVGTPGQVWIIGNEPDVIWQDNVTAAKYAAVYHELYRLIKSSDPTALIAVGGVSQATPLRLVYLDQVLGTYQSLYQERMPVDWWTIHGYVLREEKDSWGVGIPPGMDVTQGELYEVSDHGRLDLFETQLVAFRQWMAENGYQHAPLALTEFGILMPNSYGFMPEAIADYLEQTFTWLYQAQDETIGYPEDAYHLIQKWAWFSISDPAYSSSNLGDLSSGQLTHVGGAFRKLVSSMTP